MQYLMASIKLFRVSWIDLLCILEKLSEDITLKNEDRAEIPQVAKILIRCAMVIEAVRPDGQLPYLA